MGKEHKKQRMGRNKNLEVLKKVSSLGHHGDQKEILKRAYGVKGVSEAVVVIWMPMLRELLKNDHTCPCFPQEHGLCPCKPFIENLECKCGLFIVKETYRYENDKRVKVHA